MVVAAERGVILVRRLPSDKVRVGMMSSALGEAEIPDAFRPADRKPAGRGP
jgi:hypothetical protein